MVSDITYIWTDEGWLYWPLYWSFIHAGVMWLGNCRTDDGSSGL